jgi:7-cyano-7-deazaguanine synthase
MKKAVILLSGGIDSTVTMAIAKSQGYELYPLTFNYGQRNKIEIESAKKIAKILGAKKHTILDINLGTIGGSSLTSDIEVPKNRSIEEISMGIPPTYVPARNTIFLSFALALAEVIDADAIFIGANCIDYSGYPDCRPEYMEAFERMANIGTKRGVQGKSFKIIAPLIYMKKAEIIKKGIELGIDLTITHSCYDPFPDGKECGRCDSCLIRIRAFKEVGIIKL